MIGLAISVTLICASIITTALIVDANPGTETGEGDSFVKVYVKPVSFWISECKKKIFDSI